jgi:tetratricopeptide (TPR) repeat protein
MFRCSTIKPSLVAGFCLLALAGAARAVAPSNFEAGIAAGHRHDYGTAITLLTITLGRADLPAHQKAAALYERGVAYCETARYDGAIADLSEAIRLEPGRADSWRERAKAYAGEGLFDQAIADETRAIKLEPKDPSLYAERALLDFDRNRGPEAIADFTAGIGLAPRDANLRYLRGHALRAAGEPARAIEDYSRALKLDPGRRDAREERVAAYEDEGQYGKALDDLKAELLRIDDQQVRFLIGVAQWYLGRYSDAATSFAGLLRQSPQSGNFVLWFATAKTGLGDRSFDELAQSAKAIDFRIWPGPIIALYLEKLTLPQLLTLASTGTPQALVLQRCDVDFFVGEWELRAHPATAKALFRQAATACPPDFVLRHAASFELTWMH